MTSDEGVSVGVCEHDTIHRRLAAPVGCWDYRPAEALEVRRGHGRAARANEGLVLLSAFGGGGRRGGATAASLACSGVGGKWAAWETV